MRILLRFVLDCEPDAAWRAIRSSAVFREVSSPMTTFESLEATGFPELWSERPHPVSARAFGLLPMGEQVIDVSFDERGGARILNDFGGGVSGPLALVTTWRHSMAISPTADGRTLYRDRLVFGAGVLTPLVWLPLWAFWQYRGWRIRRMAPTWRA